MIYIVKYMTGEYEDYKEYPLCCFEDEEDAKALLCKAKEFRDYLYERAEKFMKKPYIDDTYLYQAEIVMRYLEALGLPIYIDDDISFTIEGVEDEYNSGIKSLRNKLDCSVL